MYTLVVPELGEGIEDATVSMWHVKQGDSVSEEQDIVEIVTNKAAFNVPTERGGIVKEILAAEGESVKIGAPLAQIDEG